MNKNPQQIIEATLQRLERSAEIVLAELEEFVLLFDAVIKRSREVWREKPLWPEGVAENPLSVSQVQNYMVRLEKIIDQTDDPVIARALLLPFRNYGDVAFKNFFIANLRKWIRKDKLVVFQLVLSLNAIGERAIPTSRGGVSSVTDEDLDICRSDAEKYLANLKD